MEPRAISSNRPCVLFSLNEVTETDIAAIRHLLDAGAEIVVVQENHFDAALEIIKKLRDSTACNTSSYDEPSDCNVDLLQVAQKSSAPISRAKPPYGFKHRRRRRFKVN
jgi:UTP-glucose-1-phosphate uridylyltransferase